MGTTISHLVVTYEKSHLTLTYYSASIGIFKEKGLNDEFSNITWFSRSRGTKFSK